MPSALQQKLISNLQLLPVLVDATLSDDAMPTMWSLRFTGAAIKLIWKQENTGQRSKLQLLSCQKYQLKLRNLEDLAQAKHSERVQHFRLIWGEESVHEKKRTRS